MPTVRFEAPGSCDRLGSHRAVHADLRSPARTATVDRLVEALQVWVVMSWTCGKTNWTGFAQFQTRKRFGRRGRQARPLTPTHVSVMADVARARKQRAEGDGLVFDEGAAAATMLVLGYGLGFCQWLFWLL